MAIRCEMCDKFTCYIEVCEEKVESLYFCSWQHLLEYAISKVSSPDTSSGATTAEFTSGLS